MRDTHTVWYYQHVQTLMNTEIPPPLCSWPRTCRRSAACLHGAMLSFKQHVVRTSVGGSLVELSTLAPNMRLSAHIRTTVACISMSWSNAGPLWGGQTRCLHRCTGPKPRSQIPGVLGILVVLAHPWLGRMEPLVATHSVPSRVTWLKGTETGLWYSEVIWRCQFRWAICVVSPSGNNRPTQNAKCMFLNLKAMHKW